MTDTPDVPAAVDNPDRSRFELHVDGHLAHLDYTVEDDHLRLVHTIVPEALGGRGLAGVLVRTATDHAVARSLTIIPDCSYARAWLEKHPDVAETATIAW